MQNREPNLVPALYRLNRLDYWYWSSHFIDFFEECPYHCTYCHVGKQAYAKGVKPIGRLPEESTVVGLGLFSDAFHPNPRWNEAVRSSLEILVEGRAGVTIQTKAVSIGDHADILKKGGDRVRVTVTLISLREEISRALEGRSPLPAARLDVLRRLREEGIPAGVSISPVIPCVNDGEEDLRELIGAAGHAGARWVLFSGFRPTTGFFIDSRWKKSRDLHTKPSELAERYRRVKDVILESTREENLPIRMPRIRVDTLSGRYSADSISEHLFTLAYLHELSGNSVEAVRYRRAAYEIDAMEGSLKSVVFRKELGYIKGVNPAVESVIEEFVDTGTSSTLETLGENLSLVAPS